MNQQEFKNIEREVFIRRPVLEEILKEFSPLKLYDYVKKGWQISAPAVDVKFFSVLKSELVKIYGREVAEKTTIQVQNKPIVSTIDHHGLFGHPIFVNSDLIYSLYFSAQDFPLILSTESVSLNNTSSWSASFIWHEDQARRASFLPDRVKNLPVFSAPAITSEDVIRFNRQTQNKFEGLVNALEHSQSFSEQASIASFRLWQTVFPSAPKLVYLPLETLVSKYLLEIFEDQNNFISQIVFSKQGQKLWQKYFGEEHTFMFWRIDERNRRIALKSLPENEEIIQLLKSRKIYASSPLCFMVLLKCGLSCVGGFTQTTWLTKVKLQLISLLSELSIEEESLAALPTKNFAESSLAWLKVNSKFITPSAADLYLTHEDYYSRYLKLSQIITLEQSLNLSMPTIYEVVVPKGERGPQVDLKRLQEEIFDHLNIVEAVKQAGF